MPPEALENQSITFADVAVNVTIPGPQVESPVTTGAAGSALIVIVESSAFMAG